MMLVAVSVVSAAGVNPFLVVLIGNRDTCFRALKKVLKHTFLLHWLLLCCFGLG